MYLYVYGLCCVWYFRFFLYTQNFCSEYSVENTLEEAHTNKSTQSELYLMIRVPSMVTFFLSVDSKTTPFMLQVVEGEGTPTLLQESEMFSFQGVTMLRLNDVILAGTGTKRLLQLSKAPGSKCK